MQQSITLLITGKRRGKQLILAPGIALEGVDQAPRREHTDAIADQHQLAQVT